MPENRKIIANSLLIHPSSQIVNDLNPAYSFLHKGTISYKYFDSNFGLLDTKTVSYLVSESQKNGIANQIYEFRLKLINILNSF